MGEKTNIMENMTTAEINIIQNYQSSPKYNILRYMNGTFDRYKSLHIVSYYNPVPLDTLNLMLIDKESTITEEVPNEIDKDKPQSGFYMKPQSVKMMEKDSIRDQIISSSHFFNKNQSLISLSIDKTSTNEKYLCWKYDCDLMYLKDFDALIDEIITIRTLNHENIIKIHEILVLQTSVLIYTSFYSLGTCESVLKYVYRTGMDYTTSMYIIKCVLEATNYLHRSKIIHRAIRGRNILISDDGRVVLCDFSTIHYASEFYEPCSIPNEFNYPDNKVYSILENIQCIIPWVAPEVLKQNIDGYSFESDIYSIGITSLELIFGDVPFSNMPPLKAFHAKLYKESSIAAKAICIFTNKYFSKKNAYLFFHRIYDRIDTIDDEPIIENVKTNSKDDIDYGYAKVFLRYSRKSNSFKYKLYKVVSNMLLSDSSKRMSINQILNMSIMKKIPHKMTLKKLTK